MNKTKPKLRLRKSVLISIPVILIVAIVSVILITSKDKLFAKSSEVNRETQTSNIIEEDSTYSLSDNEYIKSLSNLIENRQKDNTIIYYADKFNLDINKTLEIAHQITNNYEDEYFLISNSIVPENYRSKIGSFKSFEAGAIYFVKDISVYPERYGATSSIKISTNIDNYKNRHDGHIYLSNGLTYEQFLGKICDLYDVDKELALAIVYEESGIMTSGLFNYSNNMGGQRGYDGWMQFTSLESGTIFYVLTLKNLINRSEADVSTYEGILRLSGIYVRGNVNKPSEDWTRKVLLFKDKIHEKDLFTIA